jgi:hypothetical protein
MLLPGTTACGVREPPVERLLGPGDVRLLERRRVSGEAFDLAGMAGKYACQARPCAVLTRLERLAGGTRAEDLYTAFGVVGGRARLWASQPQYEERE